jgi:hypothetical protein
MPAQREERHVDSATEDHALLVVRHRRRGGRQSLRLDLQELQDRQNWPLRKGGKADRVMKSMLQMKKLDIAALQKAAA